ncbi:MAG: DUF1800 domain-containing protein [Chitinophagaceae bacterium]|nr:DUF1800 domain-containing protein [Chitinophagaceae bacterium]
MINDESILRTKHLHSRAGFGIHYTEVKNFSSKRIGKQVSNMVEQAKMDKPISIIDPYQVRILQQLNAALSKKTQLTPAEVIQKKENTEKISKGIPNLNKEWIQRMIATDCPLREKMTLFWHGHFACRDGNPYFMQTLNNIQRANALGNFRTLLVEVSRSAAMLDFLNNQQNNKSHPNENFARELMELFTLGRGNYTEDDIKQSARAFTGWTHDETGDFKFNTKTHDDSDKTFFEQTGNFDGEAIIDMILSKPATAQFISRKLYKFFVNDEPNESHVQELANHFYKSNYDIAELVHRMFTADWFYSSENRGNKIKSPIEFIVGFSRMFYVNYTKPDVLLQLQRGLGQSLFYPPNVAGWAGGKSWIDSSSLMLRMKIPSQILDNGVIDFTGKPDPDEENIVALKSNATGKTPVKPKTNAYNAFPDWERFFADMPQDFSTGEIASFLLQCPVNSQLANLIENNKGKKNTAIEVVSTPEYQLV